MAAPGAQQRAAQSFTIFENFAKMNTASSREGLPENELSWQENLHGIAPNRLLVVPAVAAAALATLASNAISEFYADISGVDYIISFGSDGAGYAINVATGAVNNFAAAGTFSTNPGPDVTTWQASRILINDPLAGYCTFDGTLFIRSGMVSPRIVVTNGGSGYSTPPPVTISGGSGTGATAHAVLSGGSVVAVILDNPGTGYHAGDVLTVTFGTGVGSGATGHVTMSGFNIAAININNAGQFLAPTGTAALTITGGGGSGAAANANIAALGGGIFTVSGVTITNPGSGYTSPPSVTLTNTPLPNPNPPSFTAVLGTETVATIVLDTGGTGYVSPPTVSIVGGGASVPATAHATLSGTSVNALILDTAGSGYTSTPTVIIGTGSGAAATAIVWPQIPAGTTLAIFQGRVWLGSDQLLQWTGTQGFDDFAAANASGALTISDADLVHVIEALRAQNNYLLIYGDQSVKQIGNITVSGSSTLFTILTLSSDQGTTFKLATPSYNRTSMFLNKNGIYAVFGSSVQKVSEDLDGIFPGIDFSQPPQAALIDLNGVHMVGFLIRYSDPFTGTTRSLVLTFNGKRWFVIVQGESLRTIVGVPLIAGRQVFGTVTNDARQLLADPATAVAFRLQTALSPHGNALQRKKVLRSGFGVKLATGTGTLNMRVDTENGTQSYAKALVAGFQLKGFSADGSGIFLGQTFTGTLAGFTFQIGALESQDTALWGDR